MRDYHIVDARGVRTSVARMPIGTIEECLQDGFVILRTEAESEQTARACLLARLQLELTIRRLGLSAAKGS
jgi:hypothetical protein